MNRAAASLLIPFTSLVLAATAFAQNTPSRTPSPGTSTSPPSFGAATVFLSSGKTIIAPGTPTSSCPVGLRAQPGVAPGTVVVVTQNDAASQKLNLQFSNPDGKGVITHAQITVHGFTAQGRLSPIVSGQPSGQTSGQPDASAIAKDVDLDLTVAPGANASRDMLFRGFTSVRWIDLDALTYADGSTWHATPQHACQITPDRMMLVASQ